MSRETINIVWLKRDLRLQDHEPLDKAEQAGIPHFILYLFSHVRKQRQMKKAHLPEKLCETCKRPFTWRKKWEKDWDAVKYCSERCKRNKT